MINESLDNPLWTKALRFWIARGLVSIGLIMILCSLPMVIGIGIHGDVIKLWEVISFTFFFCFLVMGPIWIGVLFLILVAAWTVLFGGRMIVWLARMLSVLLGILTLWAIPIADKIVDFDVSPFYIMTLGILIIVAATWIVPVKTLKISNKDAMN